jgi:ubiquinone/menaquinone biosynthesis C-methylase UbiE
MSKEKGHICPVWAGYLLACPLRRIIHSPEKILSPFVKKGMKVVDIGSGMGFFTLEIAKMVGPEGRVIAVDLQASMLEVLKRRAEKAGVSDRIETVVSVEDSLRLDRYQSDIDLALLFAVVHEVKDPEGLFQQLYQVIKEDGLIVYAEPKGHVSQESFSSFIKMAESAGFKVERELKVSLSRAVLLKKK